MSQDRVDQVLHPPGLLNDRVNNVPLSVAEVTEWPVLLDKPKHAFGRICGSSEDQKKIGVPRQRI
jgi:hypothetical protein